MRLHKSAHYLLVTNEASAHKAQGDQRWRDGCNMCWKSTNKSFFSNPCIRCARRITLDEVAHIFDSVLYFKHYHTTASRVPPAANAKRSAVVPLPNSGQQYG